MNVNALQGSSYIVRLRGSQLHAPSGLKMPVESTFTRLKANVL